MGVDEYEMVSTDEAMPRLRVWAIRLRVAAGETWRHGCNLLMELIRPLTVPNLNCNEEFWCGNCSKPALRRYLYCSQRCQSAHEEEIRAFHERDLLMAARAQERLAERLRAADPKMREALAELLTVATSKEWEGAMMYAAIHGYHGTHEGRERSAKALAAARKALGIAEPAT